MIYFVTLSLWIATIIAKDKPWAPAAVSGVLLAGFHAGLLGMTCQAYDTIYMGTGILFLLGAFYAMLNLRGLRLKA